MKRKPYTWKPKPKKEGKGLFDHLKHESKVEEWNRIRAELTKQFNLIGITRCELKLEGCVGTFGLAFAHSLKRGKIPKDEPLRTEKLMEVARLCIYCHNVIEYLPEVDGKSGHVRMEEIILNIIKNRLWQNR